MRSHNIISFLHSIKYLQLEAENLGIVELSKDLSAAGKTALKLLEQIEICSEAAQLSVLGLSIMEV